MDFAASIQTLREQDVAKDWYKAAESAATSGQAYEIKEEDLSWM